MGDNEPLPLDRALGGGRTLKPLERGPGWCEAAFHLTFVRGPATDINSSATLDSKDTLNRKP